MHIIEILNHINGVLNANIGVYIGDCHTTSKIAAAMSYISYQIIAAGRTKTKTVESTKMTEQYKKNEGANGRITIRHAPITIVTFMV